MDDDQFFADVLAVPPAPPAERERPPEQKAVDPIGDLVSEYLGATKTAATGALFVANDADPDTAGKAATIADKTGSPFAVVEQDVPAFEADQLFQRNALIVSNNGAVAGWLANDMRNARIAKDDLDKLDTVSKGLTALETGWSGAFTYNERMREQARKEFGLDQGPAYIATLDKRLADNPQMQGVYGALQTASGFAGGLLDSIFRAWDEMAIGAVLGAGAGAALTPELGGAGAAPGALTGAGIGFGVGFNTDQSLIAAGEFYLSTENVQGENGEVLDPMARHGGAALVFLGSYALNYVGLTSVRKTASTAMADLVQAAIAKPTVASALKKFGKTMATSGLEGGAIFGAMAGVQIFAEELAKQASDGDFATLFSSEEVRADALQRLLTSAAMGVVAMPVLKLPFAGTSLAVDTLRANQAMSDIKVLQDLERGATESKTRDRNLDAFQRFMQMQTDGSPIEDVYIPGAAVMQLYQSMGVEPAKGDVIFGKFVDNIAEQIAQAKETGGDIVLPLSGYISHLAGSDIAKAVQNDLRLRPDGMTLREAETYAKQRGQMLEDNAVDYMHTLDQVFAIEEPTQQVFDDVFSQLRQAGHTIDAARQYAALVASRYRTRAERLGGDANPFALYQAEGIQIRRDVQPLLRRAEVDHRDVVIDALRRGDQLPSDRKLFGPSVIEFIAKAGGIWDDGGELKTMDLDKPGLGVKFARQVIRKKSDGKPRWQNGLDEMALKLTEAGYFPEAFKNTDGRATPDDVLDAIAAELAGNPRYQLGTDREVELLFRQAVEELGEFVGRNNIDLAKTSNAKLKKLLDEAQRAPAEGQSFDQSKTTETPGFKTWFAGSKVVDDDGKPLMVFHGSARIDRVAGPGKIMKGRATSGPMPFFTDDPELASSYAKKKADTSLGDEPLYKDQFVAKVGRSKVTVDRLWWFLTPEKRAEVDRLGRRIYEEEDGLVLGPEGERNGPGGLDYEIKQQRGNVLAALVEQWLNGGILFGREGEFLKVLKMAGVTGVEYVDHNATAEGVLPVYLAIKNPLITTAIPKEVIDALNKAAKGRRAPKHKVGIDQWDKRTTSPKDWMERFHGALNDPTSYAFTVIPDWVTETLQALGYDGVRDIGGKSAVGKTHTVWVPFEPTQVKSVFNRGDFSSSDARILYQDRAAELRPDRRGSITMSDNQAVISLFRDADMSTFLHETGHLWLEEMKRDYLDILSRSPEAAEPPPPAAGFVRMYHGGAPADDVGKLWVTRSLDDAKGWAARGEGMSVSYVDVPEAELVKGFGVNTLAEAQAQGFAPLSRIELSADQAKGRKPLAGKPDVSSIAGDFETILHWMKVDSPGEITVEHHEQWARAFEAYLLEGKAPSTALARAFKSFKQWLVKIYRDITGLNTPINDELRAVFDRMLATDEEIAAARSREGLNPAFQSAGDAGMTDAEFAAYTKGVAKAQETADQKLLDRTMAAVRARRTKEWNEEAATVRAEVKDVVTSRKDLRAEHWLRTGKGLGDQPKPIGIEHARISRQALTELMGSEEAHRLLPAGTTTIEGGIHPDDAAALFGYANGDDLVKALMNLSAARIGESVNVGRSLNGTAYVTHLIDQETQAKMLERHGDALNDGSIEEEAIRAVHNVAQAEVLATELKAIGRKAGTMPVSLADMKAWVEEQINGMGVKQATNNAAFLRHEGAAGRDVQRALLKGDVRTAFILKQRQLVNHLMVLASNEARDDFEAAQKLFTRYANKSKFDALDQGYVDQMHAILKRMGYPTRRQDAELAGGIAGTSLRDFVEGKQADGFEIVAPDFLLDPVWAKRPRDMTMEELRGVQDTFTTLINSARIEKTIELDGKRAEFEAIRDEGIALLDQLPQMADDRLQKDGSVIRGPTVSAGKVDALRAKAFTYKTALRQGASSLRKIEELVDILDAANDKGIGVFNRVIFKPMADAQAKANDMRAEYTAKWIALRDGMSAAWKKALDGKRVTVPELKRKDGKPWSMTKSELLMVALNVGNESNFTKMLKGEGWDEAGVRAALDRHLTAEDWKFVQATWDIVNSLWPQIDAMQRRLTGLGPDKVEAWPVQTKHGTFKGGYFPVMYDPTLAPDVDARAKASASKLFDADYTSIGTPKGHTKRRIEDYARPFDFSFGRIAAHLEGVIHDLTHREAVMQAQRFVSNKDIRAGIVGAIGKENYDQFLPWLKHIANEKAIDQRGLHWFDGLAKGVRLNATLVGLGFRASTMMMQIAGYSDSAEMIGAKGVAQGFAKTYGFRSPLEAVSAGLRGVSATKVGKAIGAKYLAAGFDAISGHPRKFQAARDFVMERSGEMRHRFESLDRDLAQGLRELMGKRGALNDARRFAYYGIAMMDQAVVIPSWIGGFQKALAEGKTEAEAIYYADKVVRLGQGAGAAKDLAAVQRSHNEWFKLTTMFYSYFNHVVNRQFSIARQAKSGAAAVKAGDFKQARHDFAMVLARSWWLLVVPPLLSNLIVGRGPEEDEDTASWAMRKVFFNLFGGVPIVRDVAALTERKVAGTYGEFKLSPAERMIDVFAKTGDDAYNATFGDDPVSDRWVKHAIETSGYAFGLPGAGQAGTSVQYMWDVADGRERPKDAGEFVGSVLFGPKKD